jgi:hypothetical protein
MLQAVFRISRTHTLCYLSIPSCIFFFLPFSEAVFFLSGSIVLIGLHRQKQLLVVTGLVLCSLARGTAMFFIPAIILMEILAKGQASTKKSFTNIVLYTCAALAGLAIVVLIQYAQTYEWFAFAKVQTKFYHHIFSWPRFPLTSYADAKILWLDGPAFFFGLVATAVAVAFLISFLLKKNEAVVCNKAFVFSTCYLVMTTMYAVFFNPKNGDGFTGINSLNRYFFATPFFFLFMVFSLRTFDQRRRNLILFFSVALVAWIGLGLGRPLPFLTNMFETEMKIGIFFAFLTVYTSLFYFTVHPRFGTYCAHALFGLNMLLSVYALNLYISGGWVA